MTKVLPPISFFVNYLIIILNIKNNQKGTKQGQKIVLEYVEFYLSYRFRSKISV